MVGPRRPGRLVGRTEELAALDDAFEAAADGLVVVLLGGDPGVGKTALARAFSDDLRKRGVPVDWGSSAEVGGAPAYWPWIQVLRSIGDTAFERARERLTASADEPFPAFEVVDELLRARSGTPRVIVLDDLHRADLPSLHLLRHLVASTPDVPLLVIGTHRRHELRADPERDVVLAAVAAGARRIEPANLGLEEVCELLDTELDDALEAAVAADVLARSGGNPLYVTHLVHAVEREGAVALAGLPDGIRAAVRASLAPLPEPTRELLARATVLGRSFAPEVLAALAGVAPADVRIGLAPAVAAGILTRTADELAFTHALVHDAIGDDLDPGDRRAAHAAAAVALAQAPTPAPAAVVAQHLVDAGPAVEVVEAARWAEEAAAAARRISGHGEAGRWAEEAAGLWARAGDPERQGDALAGAIAARVAVGDGHRALELAVALADLARTTGSARLLARAALARTTVFEPTQDLDAPPLLREALAHPDLGHDPELRAAMLAGLAATLGMPSIDGTRRDEAGALAAVAELEDLAAAGDRTTEAHLLVARLNVLSGPLHHHDRVRWLARYDELVPVGANTLDRIHRLYWATSLAFEAGDLPAVEKRLREWELLAERSESAFWTWRASMARASLTYAQGRLARAEELAVARADLVASLHPDMAFRVVAGLVFGIRRDQRRLDEVVGLDEAQLGGLALIVAAERGDLGEARRLLVALRAAAASSGPDDLFWLCVLSMAAVAADLVGDQDAGRWVADELEPFADQAVMWGRSYVFGMPVTEAIGLGRRAAGEREAAAAAFEAEVDWADRVGAPGFGARGRVALASVLDPDDPRRAQLAGEARATAHALGLALVVAEADALLAGQPSQEPPAAEAPAVHAGASPATAPAEAPRVAVRTLGRFEVIGAGCTEPARWSSRK
ncbi:MAG TPA: AAA family ATPase, partial [Aquihabitans sp.]|nr:AAA family ATPase [Aquihabitans sp.]